MQELKIFENEQYEDEATKFNLGGLSGETNVVKENRK